MFTVHSKFWLGLCIFVTEVCLFQVPFFSDEENSNTPKADAFFVPRENPRALFIRPVDKEKSTPPKDRPTPVQENGKLTYLHSSLAYIYIVI